MSKERLETHREPALRAMKNIDYDEGIVIGSYTGKLEKRVRELEHQNKRYREAIENAVEELTNHIRGHGSMLTRDEIAVIILNKALEGESHESS